MEESHTLVATEDGHVIGVYCGTLYAGRLHGRDVTVTLGCHSRIADGQSGGGVWATLTRTLLERVGGRFDVPLAFVLAGNAAASRLTTAGAWPAHPVRAVVACASDGAPAPPPSARAATPSDAGALVEALNATFAGQDLFRPYTVESLTARLERAPDLYGWEDIWLTDEGAVVGVGRAFQRRTTTDSSGTRTERRALVFDYAVPPDGVDAFWALLAARGAQVARSTGATHLSVFTSPGARAHDAVVAWAAEVEVYDVLIPGQTPADDASSRGIYVDQVHF